MADQVGEKARRRAARALVGEYHERELAALLEHVREGFARLDARELDAFELDELIHRYERSTRELWKFLQSRPAETAAWMLQNEGEIDWWAAGEPRRR